MDPSEAAEGYMGEGAGSTLKSFLEYLEFAARTGKKAAMKLVDDLLKVEETSSGEEDNPALAADGAEESAAAAFLEYLYNAAKAGSSSEADLFAQSVGAASDENG
ncbi:hypothetical protein HDU96_000767, partial [Phlyctochytrium bullatum]